MKVKISDVNKMIKEEFQKMLEKKKLSSRLAQINEALSQMSEEDAKLNEVEAGGKTTVASNSWVGKPNGDVKFKPEFEKIGSSLKEDGTEGIEDTMESPESVEGSEGEATIKEVPMGEFEAKFAEIGKAIDTKLSAEAGAGIGTGAEMSDEPKGDDFEEVEVGGPSSEGPTDSNETEVDEAAKTAIKEEVPANQHLNPETAVKSTEEDSKLKGDVQESVDEPLEGHSVAQEVEADKVNDNMEKDTHVKESKDSQGEIITEAKTAKGNIFTEGLDDKKKASLLAEMKRMNKFAGLSKDDDEK